MAKKKIFQIRSKKDAKYLAEEIYGTNFYYYAPLMGLSGGMKTIFCYPGEKKCTICSSAPGWQKQEETSMHGIADYLWKDRKLINAELRYGESE